MKELKVGDTVKIVAADPVDDFTPHQDWVGLTASVVGVNDAPLIQCCFNDSVGHEWTYLIDPKYLQKQLSWDDLVVGERYVAVSIKHGYRYIFQYSGGFKTDAYIDLSMPEYLSNSHFEKDDTELSEATPDEVLWLRRCIEAMKFVPDLPSLEIGGYYVCRKHNGYEYLFKKRDNTAKTASTHNILTTGDRLWINDNAAEDVEIESIRPATQQETDWLDRCIKADMVVPSTPEQPKQPDMVDGGVYWLKTNEGREWFFKYRRSVKNKASCSCSIHIKSRGFYNNDSKVTEDENIADLRPATEQERVWFERCVKAGEYIPPNPYLNSKIWVTAETSKQVQEKLFESGCEWIIGGMILKYTDRDNMGILIDKNGILMYTCTKSTFVGQYLKELYLSDLGITPKEDAPPIPPITVTQNTVNGVGGWSIAGNDCTTSVGSEIQETAVYGGRVPLSDLAKNDPSGVIMTALKGEDWDSWTGSKSDGSSGICAVTYDGCGIAEYMRESCGISGEYIIASLRSPDMSIKQPKKVDIVVEAAKPRRVDMGIK